MLIIFCIEKICRLGGYLERPKLGLIFAGDKLFSKKFYLFINIQTIGPQKENEFVALDK